MPLLLMFLPILMRLSIFKTFFFLPLVNSLFTCLVFFSLIVSNHVYEGYLYLWPVLSPIAWQNSRLAYILAVLL